MKHYIITIFAMLALSVGSASCSEDEPLQGTGQQTTPNNGITTQVIITTLVIITIIMKTSQ